MAVDTAILHLAPIARETPRAWPRSRAEFVGLTPQGLVRAWDARGEIARVPLRPSSCRRAATRRCSSERERGVLRRAARRAPPRPAGGRRDRGRPPDRLTCPAGTLAARCRCRRSRRRATTSARATCSRRRSSSRSTRACRPPRPPPSQTPRPRCASPERGPTRSAAAARSRRGWAPRPTVPRRGAPGDRASAPTPIRADALSGRRLSAPLGERLLDQLREVESARAPPPPRRRALRAAGSRRRAPSPRP